MIHGEIVGENFASRSLLHANVEYKTLLAGLPCRNLLGVNSGTTTVKDYQECGTLMYCRSALHRRRVFLKKRESQFESN